MKQKLILALFPLAMLQLTACSGDSEISSSQSVELKAAIDKACGHFEPDGNVIDIFGMEKDFLLLAKVDIQYLRLAELATKYIEDFVKAIDSSVGKTIYPKVPRLLENFCTTE